MILDNIDRPLIVMTGFASHQLYFFKLLFRLSTQGPRITMLELILLVIACLHNTQNDVGGIFTEEELLEIKTTNSVVYPELPNDVVEFLLLFENGTTTNELRKLIYTNSSYNLDYNHERDQVKDWICRALTQLLPLYSTPLAFTCEHSEQWFQTRVWVFLEYALEEIRNVLASRGEQSSTSSSDRMNASRVVPSIEKIESKKFGSRVDMIARLHGVELVVEEDKPTNDSTKMLEDRSFKIAKEMKDALWGQFQYTKYDKAKLRGLTTFGICTFGFDIFFDTCDYQNGYTSRITRSKRFSIPTDLQQIEDILQLLAMVLTFKMMIQSNVDVLTGSGSSGSLRQKLKRPHEDQDNTFVKVTKLNHCAQSPTDDSTGRFKSIYKKYTDACILE